MKIIIKNLNQFSGQKRKNWSAGWLSIVKGLSKEGTIIISFDKRKESQPKIKFILIELNDVLDGLVNPDFNSISFSDLIEKELSGFKIIEADKEIEKQILKK